MFIKEGCYFRFDRIFSGEKGLAIPDKKGSEP
jgi:hypothetical protein